MTLLKGGNLKLPVFGDFLKTSKLTNSSKVLIKNKVFFMS